MDKDKDKDKYKDKYKNKNIKYNFNSTNNSHDDISYNNNSFNNENKSNKSNKSNNENTSNNNITDSILDNLDNLNNLENINSPYYDNTTNNLNNSNNFSSTNTNNSKNNTSGTNKANSNSSYTNKLFNNNKILIIASIVILVFSLAGYIVNLNSHTVTSIGINSGENVYTYDSYIYLYGKNGIKILKDDNILLKEEFSIENPFVVTCEDKVAISDRNGKVIRIYSSTAQMYTLTFMDTILGFNINNNGYISVITKINDNYGINVFNENGTELYAINDISLNEGIPVATALSHDNKVLGISYLNIYDPTVSSNIVLHSMSNNIAFGGSIKKNQIVTSLNFSSDNNLIGISDKEIFAIKISTNRENLTSREIYQNVFENSIKYITFLDKDNFVICYGNPVMGGTSEIENNTLIFYNSSGSEKGKYIIQGEITSLFANEYGVIISNNRLFTGISKSGAKAWEYQATQDIKNVLFYENRNKIVIVSNNDLKITNINKTLFDADLVNTEELEETKDYDYKIDNSINNKTDSEDDEYSEDKNNLNDLNDLSDDENKNSLNNENDENNENNEDNAG